MSRRTILTRTPPRSPQNTSGQPQPARASSLGLHPPWGSGVAPLPSVPAPGRTDSARVEDLPGSHASPPDLGRGVQRGSPGVRAGHPAPWRCALTSPGAGAPPGKGGQLISGHPAHGPPKAPKPEPVERTAADAPHSGTSSLECGRIPAKPGNSGVFWGPRRPADPLTQGPEPQAAGVCAYTESSPTTHEPSPILNTVHAPPPAWSAFQMARGLQPHHPWSPLPPPTQNPPRHPESEKSRLPLPHKRQTDCKPRTPGGRGRRTHEWDGVSVPVRIAIYSRSCQNHHRGFTEGCVRGGGGSNTD